MAEIYASYMLGSVTVAYISKLLYNYTNTTPNIAENIIVHMNDFEDIEDIEDAGDSYKCILCSEKKSLDCFSKNQQKKKKMGEWKCKSCTV
jgi:hypothetical protein